MKRFPFWLAENTQSIRVDLTNFKAIIQKEIDRLIDHEADRVYKLKYAHTFNPSVLLPFNYARKDILIKSVGTPEFNREQAAFYNWGKQTGLAYERPFRDAWYHLMNQNEVLNGVDENYEKYFHEIQQKIIVETEQNMQRLVGILQQAVGRIASWHHSPILLEPVESYSETFTNRVNLDGADSAHVYVGAHAGPHGPKYAMFSMFYLDGKIEIDDVLESGEDEEFFDGNEDKADYYMLINELKKPGSTSQGKVLTLFTARPKKDRDFFNATTYLPHGIFLTSSFSDADGLAQDLPGGERDIWKVRIDSKYLTMVLDQPGFKHYMVSKEHAPIQSMTLY